MENTATTQLEMLFEKAEDYTRTTIELAKLNAIDKSADVISSLISRLAILAVVAIFILFINIGVALWIGELLGKSYYGFFIVASFYIIIVFLLNNFKDQWLKMPVSNFIISKMLKKKSV